MSRQPAWKAKVITAPTAETLEERLEAAVGTLPPIAQHLSVSHDCHDGRFTAVITYWLPGVQWS